MCAVYTVFKCVKKSYRQPFEQQGCLFLVGWDVKKCVVGVVLKCAERIRG